MSDAPTAKRRWFRFSLKTLFALVTVLGILCGWFAINIGEARHQKRIVEQIQEMHLSVDYDRGGKPDVLQEWLVRIFGIDFCFDVGWVRTNKQRLDDSQLERLIPLLKELPKLQYLHLGYSDISDAHLK